MTDELRRIIETSTFEVIPGNFIYAKVFKAPSIDNHFLISKDADEITVVTKKENLGELKLLEKNKDYWALLSLNISAPFYSVGFLAAVSNSIASQEMNVLIVSTYSKDYILVKADLVEKAKKALLNLGFKEKK